MKLVFSWIDWHVHVGRKYTTSSVFLGKLNCLKWGIPSFCYTYTRERFYIYSSYDYMYLGSNCLQAKHKRFEITLH